MSDPKRIVMLYADTGGGHRSTAQAIKRALAHGHAYDVQLVNGTPYMPYPFNQAEVAYPLCVNRARWVYRIFWQTTNNRAHTTAVRRYIEAVGRHKAQAFLQQHPADLYVSCHPIVNQVVPGIVKQHCPNTPVLGVVSDLATVHAGFWSPKVDHYFVPTEQARQRAIRNRIAPNAITITGQPVCPNFAARVQTGRAGAAKAASSRPSVLLMGGGDGMGRLIETTLALANSNLPIELVVVCGRNEQARQTLLQAKTSAPMRVLGFCENVPELMGAADVLVTKAGPGSICEGFIAGLPILLYDAVPGQEAGNIGYVVEQGAGAWCPSPQQTLAQLTDWLAQPDKLNDRRRASAALAQPNSALHIAQVIAQFAAQDSPQFNAAFARPKHTLATVNA